MAPRFENLMYQVYTTESRSEAVVGFPTDQIPSIFPFRDRLAKLILREPDLGMHKIEGIPLALDSLCRFFPKQEEPVVKKLDAMKYPGIFACLFKTNRWFAYKSQEKEVERVTRVEMETSHDFPCLIIYSSIHSEEALSDLVQNVSREMGLSISRNKKLGPIDDIVTSNRRFKLEET